MVTPKLMCETCFRRLLTFVQPTISGRVIYGSRLSCEECGRMFFETSIIPSQPRDREGVNTDRNRREYYSVSRREYYSVSLPSRTTVDTKKLTDRSRQNLLTIRQNAELEATPFNLLVKKTKVLENCLIYSFMARDVEKFRHYQERLNTANLDIMEIAEERCRTDGLRFVFSCGEKINEDAYLTLCNYIKRDHRRYELLSGLLEAQRRRNAPSPCGRPHSS